MPELVSAGTMVTGNPDSVQEGTETVAGLQAKYAGGAPMLATPNCQLPRTSSCSQLTISFTTLVSHPGGAKLDPTLLRQRSGPHDGHPIRT